MSSAAFDPVPSSIHLPRSDGIFLDHVAHWVPDIRASASVFGRLGFTLTPYSQQKHRSVREESPVVTGGGNHCIMLQEGYVEVLAATGDTAITREVRHSLARHTGLHVTAFGVNDAAAHHARLVASGFPQRALVSLERETSGPNGEVELLRFTVTRPEVGCLAEGRVQFLTHHTPELLWQKRWLDHPNTARALTDILFCVADPQGARTRYERYLGRVAEAITGGFLFHFDRGRLALMDIDHVADALPNSQLSDEPFMAAYAIACTKMAETRSVLKASGIDFRDAGDSLCLAAPSALGGSIAFTEGNTPPPWLKQS